MTSIRRRRIAAALLALAAAPALARTRDVATPSGPAVDCIPIAAIDHTVVQDDSTIDFHMRPKQVYRVTLPQPCPQLGFQRRFSYGTSLSQLCASDIINVLFENGSPRGASCGLDKFQPVTITKG